MAFVGRDHNSLSSVVLGDTLDRKLRALIPPPTGIRTQHPSLVLSVFTGAGGLDLGLEAAGFRVVGCIENDPTARETLKINRPQWALIGSGDATEIAPTLKPEALGLRPRDLAVLAGGPPCQPFSKAALWAPNGAKGLQDPRSNTLAALLQLLEGFLPHVLIVENVPEFVRGKTSAVPLIRAVLERLNSQYGTRYRLDIRLVNAADYGVPQRRLRAILVAIRNGASLHWPEPTHRDAPIRSWDAIGKVVSRVTPLATGRWTRLLSSIPEGKNYLWHAPGGGGTPLFGYRTRYWSFLLKLAKNEPAWTIPAQPGPATGPFHWDNRPLSTEELLRLQTFPSCWRIVGSYRQQGRQIGNATPPLLAEIIGRSIGGQIFRLGYPRLPQFAIERRYSVPSPRMRTGIPRLFLRRNG